MRHFVHIGSVISLYGYRLGYCAFLCMCVVYLLNVRVKVKESECLCFFCVHLCLCACMCVRYKEKIFSLCVFFVYCSMYISGPGISNTVLCMSGKKHRLI